MNTRVCAARNGYYYVQTLGWNGWRRNGGFFRTRIGAIDWARTLKYGPRYPRVVQYV